MLNYFPFDFFAGLFAFLAGADFVLEAAGFAAVAAFLAADECLGFEGEAAGAGALSTFGVAATGAAGGADSAGAAMACCHPGVNISNRSRETELARRQRGQTAS